MEKTVEKVSKPAGEAKTLHKESLHLGNREYTFEFRESAKGNRFITVSDSHERNGKMTRDSIMVFQDQIPKFTEALQRTIEFASKK